MSNEDINGAKPTPESRPKCGIVMPISDLDGYPPGHWEEVLQILKDSIPDEFDSDLVSNADEVTVIHKTIVQNLYDSAIVICDVSGKNPNVMFELGMRLTFDKPTIIVMDSRTDFSFDTAPIEHLRYPSDLRFHKIVDFKKKLGEKISATYAKARNDATYSPFLGHFGQYKVAGIETTEVTSDTLILKELADLRELIKRGLPPALRVGGRTIPSRRTRGPDISIRLHGQSQEQLQDLLETISNRFSTIFRSMNMLPDGKQTHVIEINLERDLAESQRGRIYDMIGNMLPDDAVMSMVPVTDLESISTGLKT